MRNPGFYDLGIEGQLCNPATPPEHKIFFSHLHDMPQRINNFNAFQGQYYFLLMLDDIDATTKTGFWWGTRTEDANKVEMDNTAIAKFWREAHARLHQIGLKLGSQLEKQQQIMVLGIRKKAQKCVGNEWTIVTTIEACKQTKLPVVSF